MIWNFSLRSLDTTFSTFSFSEWFEVVVCPGIIKRSWCFGYWFAHTLWYQLFKRKMCMLCMNYFFYYVACRDNKELVRKLSTPPPGSQDLYFPTLYSQNGWGQFKSCLWKQYLSYWRSPSYNLMRSIYMLFASLLFGVVFWDQGKKM